MDEKIREVPIGTKVKLPFLTIEVVESEYGICEGCLFEEVDKCSFCSSGFGECVASLRTDKKQVVFKVINE
jgi:hypothetical protein